MAKKYGEDRRTEIVLLEQLAEEAPETEEIPATPIHLFLSKQGYFKKISPQSLRMSGEQKYKEGDGPAFHWETTNGRRAALLHQPAAVLQGLRLRPLMTARPASWATISPPSWRWTRARPSSGRVWPGITPATLLFFFENGKVARVPLSAYQTVTRRKKLTGAYSDKSPLKDVLFLPEGTEEEVVLYSTEGRALLFQTDGIPVKTTRSTQGVQVMTLKKSYKAEHALPLAQTKIVNRSRYRARSLPAAGALVKAEDQGDTQMSLL